MRYLLIDGNHLAGRCWATMKELMTTDGRSSGVVHGFLRNLTYLRKEMKIEISNFSVVWDGGHAAWRKKLYPQYKAGRYPDNPTPEQIKSLEDYRVQLSALKEALSYLGVSTAKVSGMEADDLLGIYSNWIAGHNGIAIIHSGDHDMHQLVSKNIWISDPNKKVQHVDDILRYYEITDVNHVLLLKALWGDKSDNVDGVKGIGEVKAKKLLSLITEFDEHSKVVTFSSDSREVQTFRSQEDKFWRNLELLRIPKEAREDELDQVLDFYKQMYESSQKPDYDQFSSFLEDWEIKTRMEDWL